tara:strand:+ start:268 stop:1068 length:801 start_codon:yes stop_codon:yes gene_type:complete
MRITIPKLKEKKSVTPIVCLTSYNFYTSKLIDPYIDLQLVGDSLGMVVYGMKSTIGVSLQMMILHGKAVVSGSSRSLVVIDMPFGSYEESPSIAFKNASLILKETGCQAVKIEGGSHMAETVKFLVNRGIPVMGHIGLTPQSLNKFGGFKTQGLTYKEWEQFEKDALDLENAGAFAIVIEGVASDLATKITQNREILTIGIGASAKCDGQILVTEDLLGLSDYVPKFVKKYINLNTLVAEAVESYANEVKERKFPSKDNIYEMKKK